MTPLFRTHTMTVETGAAAACCAAAPVRSMPDPRSAQTAAHWALAFAAPLRRAWQGVRPAWAGRRARGEGPRTLATLDARTLADIGLAHEGEAARRAADDARWRLYRTGGF